LATSIEWQTKEIAATEDTGFSGTLEGLFQSLASSDESALLLDFDGTLAPFRVDPSKARLWAGVADLLGEIQQTGHTRLAIVTGRPAVEVALLLGMRVPPEIWGLHGSERLYPDGRFEQEELVSEEQALLDEARSVVRAARLGVRIEDKRNAVVVHWRGKSRQSAHVAQNCALKLLDPFAIAAGMRLLQFDGGLELRAGHNKGDVVHTILEEIPASAPVAYLGDDATDEDAFLALAGRGFSLLVRREWRPTAAQTWLRPPNQLREFLKSWLRAIQH